ncbi:MAG TPA: hypothetical protein VHY79_00850 [Rhizomicrobium sp.]|jgi:hypothetical protein|nr:hypothetical protein [Rhizomicrobium sp.]
MSDIGNNGVTKFLANGGGAITFRLLATAMGALIIWLVRMEGEQLTERLNRIEASISAVGQVAQDASARGDVNAVRLTTLDGASADLWRAVNANASRLDDHEHRISELEGVRHR